MLLMGKGSNLGFYAILEAQADAACRAAETFMTIAKDFTNLDECALLSEQIEHEADGLTHQLLNKIDTTFITPLDKEDLHKLASVLDDVVDTIETTVSRLVIYDIREPQEDLEAMLEVLVNITRATRRAVGGLRNMRDRKTLQASLDSIHDAEHIGDQLFRQSLKRLFRLSDPDPLFVMKWKEIYDRIERAIDTCENVADAIESISIKYA